MKLLLNALVKYFIVKPIAFFVSSFFGSSEHKSNSDHYKHYNKKFVDQKVKPVVHNNEETAAQKEASEDLTVSQFKAFQSCLKSDTVANCAHLVKDNAAVGEVVDNGEAEIA